MDRINYYESIVYIQEQFNKLRVEYTISWDNEKIELLLLNTHAIQYQIEMVINKLPYCKIIKVILWDLYNNQSEYEWSEEINKYIIDNPSSFDRIELVLISNI